MCSRLPPYAPVATLHVAREPAKHEGAQHEASVVAHSLSVVGQTEGHHHERRVCARAREEVVSREGGVSREEGVSAEREGVSRVADHAAGLTGSCAQGNGLDIAKALAKRASARVASRTRSLVGSAVGEEVALLHIARAVPDSAPSWRRRA